MEFVGFSLFQVSVTLGKGKGKGIGLRRPLEFQEVEAPRMYRQSAHEDGRIYLLEISLVLVSVRLSRQEGVSDPIGNRSRDLAGCSAVPEPTSLPPRTPQLLYFKANEVKLLTTQNTADSNCNISHTHTHTQDTTAPQPNVFFKVEYVGYQQGTFGFPQR